MIKFAWIICLACVYLFCSIFLFLYYLIVEVAQAKFRPGPKIRT